MIHRTQSLSVINMLLGKTQSLCGEPALFFALMSWK